MSKVSKVSKVEKSHIRYGPRAAVAQFLRSGLECLVDPVRRAALGGDGPQGRASVRARASGLRGAVRR